MRRLSLLLGLVLAVPLVWASPAGAQQYGEIRMTMHTHSNDDPDWTGLLFPTDRLPFDFGVGDTFSYSSRTCGGSAPFNDVGLNFIPDYPGVDDDADHTAAVRHGIQGTVIAAGPTSGAIQGRITTVLCVPGPVDPATGRPTMVESPHSIVSYYWVHYERVGDNVLLVNGGFLISPTESTGTFRDMQGGGRIEGRFTCLGHQRNPSLPSCAELGHFTDFVGHAGDPRLGPGVIQPGAVGTYYDPTVTTGSSAA